MTRKRIPAEDLYKIHRKAIIPPEIVMLYNEKKIRKVLKIENDFILVDNPKEWVSKSMIECIIAISLN